MITLKKKFVDSYSFVFNKTVIVRVDLNVPTEENTIKDNTRILKVLPTISKLLEQKAKIILISHFGRPKGQHLQELSLRFLVNELEKLTEQKIHFIDTNIKNLNKSDFESKFKEFNIIMLENIRFYNEEEKNLDKFSQQISSFGDIYINECFSSSHRKHASISGIPKYLPSFPGKLLENEVQNLKNLFLVANESDSVAILGGAKISTKIKLIEFYAKKYSKVIVGGAMANTLNFAQGYDIGDSLYEKKMTGFAKALLTEYSNKIVLPIDCIVTDKKLQKNPEAKLINEITNKDMIVDIGPKTRMLFYNEILKAKIILWNGPLGLFEKKPFDEGTIFVLSAVKANKNKNFFSVAGGGDTISLLNDSNSYNEFSFVSTGGGAFLEFVQGKSMPGLSSLNV